MKKLSRKTSLTLLTVIGLISTVNAADEQSFFQKYLIDSQDGMLDVSRYLSEVPFGFLPVPAIITEPAVGYGLALGMLFFHETEEQRKQRTDAGVLLPNNISMLAAGATENGTRFGGVGHLGFWRNDSIRYRGAIGFGNINIDFYSIPGLGDLPRSIELEMTGPVVFQDLRFRLPNSDIFVGARQLYREVDSELANQLDMSSLPPPVTDYFQEHLDNDVSTSGLGAILEYDSRDSQFNPQKGYYYHADYTVFDDAFGSDYDFETFVLKALNYWELSERFNLAVRAEVDGLNADSDERLPAYVPPFINLRGVPKARYQGSRVAVAEVELDYKINFRWKVGLFTGIGRAAESFSDFDDADHVHSYGTGFRYLVARRYGFAMGFDVARGPEEWAVYLQAGSSWN